MSKFNKAFKRFGAIMSAAVVASAAIITVTTSNPGQANAAINFGGPRDCDANAVIYCGTKTQKELSDNYFHGNSHNSAKSIQNIYSYFNINGGDIHNTSFTAKRGHVTKQGNVVLNGKVVATNAVTSGRQYIAGSKKVNHKGTTFYTRSPSVSFVSSQISAFVVMKNGQFQYAVLSSCGNPVFAKPVKPEVKPGNLTCTQLTTKQVSNKEYTYTVKGATKNAALTHYYVDYGDGTHDLSKSASFKHTYAKAGTYKVQGVVFGTINNKGTMASSKACQTNITVAQPERDLVCQNLIVKQDGDSQQYTFTVPTTSKNVTGVSYTIDFGDGTSYTGTSKTVSHVYAGPGNYKVKATVTSNEVKDITSEDCVTEITIPEEVKDCKPGIPVGSPECETVIKTTKPQQPAPKQLVKTGPSEVIGMFIATTIAGTVASKLFMRRHYQA